jgi:hypothetical protein
MNRILQVVAAAFALTAAALAASRPAQVPSMSTVMRDKLENTQELLEALVTADYAAMDAAAMRLGRVTEAEIGRWQTPGDPEYTRQGVLFMTAVQGLREASMDRDAEAAGYYYTALVSTCVRCHAHVRRVRLALADVEPGSVGLWRAR